MDLHASARRHLPAPVWDIIKVAKYKFDIWTFPHYVASHRYGPHEFRLNIHDRVAKEWYDKDWELPYEIEFLSRHGLAGAGRVFNLGAHQCLIAMLLAKKLAPQGRVIAVEANRHNVAVAHRNIEANGVDNVDIIHGLISSTTGTSFAAASFNSHATAPGQNTLGSSVITSLTIDDLARRVGRPNVVYIDIEGHEIEALRGARATLERPCSWFIELHGDAVLSQYGARNQDVLSFFRDRPYAAYLSTADSREFRPLGGERMPSDRCFVFFIPTAVNGVSAQ